MRAPEMLDHKADLMVRLDDPRVRAVWRQQVLMDMVKSDTEREAADVAGAVDNDPQHIWAVTKHPSVKFKNGLSPESARGNSAATVEGLRHSLAEAECFHVNEDLTSLVTYAASQLDDLDRLDRSILPTRSGIARFEGGLPFQDVRGRKMRISWAAWCPVLYRTQSQDKHDVGEPDECTLLFLFNDHREEPDDIYRMLLREQNAEGRARYERAFGRWGFIGSEYVMDGVRLGPAFAEPSEAKRAEVLADGDTPQGYTNSIRLMHAFWLLLGQTVSLSTEAQIDRARRKRTGRMGIPHRVTVVQLRRTEGSRAEGESLVEWSHRWVVRGHWAWYHCGPDHPQAQEVEPGRFMCRLWRAPFVKGPKDKPLVVTEKVYALHR
jgi:hypothetical protein